MNNNDIRQNPDGISGENIAMSLGGLIIKDCHETARQRFERMAEAGVFDDDPQWGMGLVWFLIGAAVIFGAALLLW